MKQQYYVRLLMLSTVALSIWILMKNTRIAVVILPTQTFATIQMREDIPSSTEAILKSISIYDRINITVISDIRKASFAKEIGGCGVTFRMEVNGKHHYFFKSQTAANVSHFDAESHLQEIMACRLNDILFSDHSGAVPPCHGQRLYETDLLQTPQPLHVNNIFRMAECNVHQDLNSNESFITGSLMEWSPVPLATVDQQRIVEAAIADSNKTGTSLQIIHSAVSYAVFHYLGACMKSGHNHFAVFHGKSPTKFVAIDNDRCFTLREISSNSNVPAMHRSRITLWETLVLHQIPCENFPPGIVAKILELAKNNGTSITSNLLTSSLQDDILATELLNFVQPKALNELDNRIQILANRLEIECGKRNER